MVSLMNNSIPCRIGTCTTPLVLTSSQLIASQLCPTYVVEALLYPGAIANAIFRNKPVPSFENLNKIYKFTSENKAGAATDLRHIEVCFLNHLHNLATTIRVGHNIEF